MIESGEVRRKKKGICEIMNNEKQCMVSVIIPIYKVEAYLERCVESVLAQTYQDMEIILVDDGSPDRCGEICDNMADKDSRIKVYHKQNGGLSDARNYGVKVSTGKYIAFIDSDDFVAPDYFEYLLGLLEKNDADIACCCMVRTEGNTAHYCIDDEMPNEQVLLGKEACKALLGNLYMVLVTAWGKLYDRNIVEKYLFPVGRVHEDEATTCKYYYESKKTVVGNKCLYAYFQNKNGIMQTRRYDFNSDAAWALGHRAEFFAKNKERELEIGAWKRLFDFYIQDSQKYNGRCDNLLKGFGKKKRLGIMTRVSLWLYNVSPKFYYFFLRVMRKLGKMGRRNKVS